MSKQRRGGRGDDWMGRFDALAIASEAVASRPSFIGGFVNQREHKPLPPLPPLNAPPYPSPLEQHSVGGFCMPGSSTMPAAGPQMPIPPPSLTMQYALGANAGYPPYATPQSVFDGADFGGHYDWTTRPPQAPPIARPYSESAIPAASSPLAASPPQTPARPSPGRTSKLQAPTLPPRPHSDPQTSSPLRQKPSPAVQIPAAATPKRHTRATSAPPSPASPSPSTTGDSGAVQCSGVTKAGKRCTRPVKARVPLEDVDPDVQMERFCFQHSKELMGPTGFYSRKHGTVWVEFEKYIPAYLHPDTQLALRLEMEKSRSLSDVPGYIYTFEIRDTSASDVLHLKVGRAVNLVRRIDQWGKQCGSKEQVLRGFWPGEVLSADDPNGVDVVADATSTSLMKGRVRAGTKGAWCHRLERLVHLELADLVLSTPYLQPGFRAGVRSSDRAGTGDTVAPLESNPSTPVKGRPSVPSASATGSPAASPRKGVKKAAARKCPDCGAMHKEIFSFQRASRGRYKGREWESIVQPVIERWGRFVEEHL